HVPEGTARAEEGDLRIGCGHAELSGDFVVREAFHVVQHHHGALAGVQPVEGALEIDGGRGGADGWDGEVLYIRRVAVAGVDAVAVLAGGEAGPGRADADGAQPGAELGGAVERA